MKVQELIEQLQKFPKDHDVVITDSDGNYVTNLSFWDLGFAIAIAESPDVEYIDLRMIEAERGEN
jgi:hypothetical protein